MRSTMSLIGILLVIFGIAVFAYKGFTYTQREQVAQIGDIKVTADTEKTVYFSPVVGGIALVAGLGLVVLGRRGGN